MTERAPERIWSSIDLTKTIAGTLAAVSAAVVGSFLGVAGTLVGAAVASIVGSVGTELYHRWIDRSSKKIKSTFVTAPAAVGTPPVAGAEHESPAEPPPAPAPRQIRWGRVAMVAGALFALAMGTLTAFELVTGKSAADAMGNSSRGSTTITSVLQSKKQSDNPTPGASSPAPSSNGTSEPAGSPATGSPDPASPGVASPAPTSPGAASPEPAGTTGPQPSDTAGTPAETSAPGPDGGTNRNVDPAGVAPTE